MIDMHKFVCDFYFFKKNRTPLSFKFMNFSSKLVPTVIWNDIFSIRAL